MYVEMMPFRPPSDSNIRIWRYMDFAKFCSLIDSSALHFVSIDQLDDAYEGAFPEASFGGVVGLLQNHEENAALEQRLNKHVASEMDDFRRVNRLSIFVNCWHMNDFGSQAMWTIYSGLGIGLQSTFTRLAQSFNEPDEKVYISEIEYVDYTDTPVRLDPDDWIEPSLFKRKPFEFESALRAFVVKPPLVNGEFDCEAADQPKAFTRRVDLGTLIEQAYISPGRRTWFETLTRNSLIQYGYGYAPVLGSTLDHEPHTRTWDGRLLSVL